MLAVYLICLIVGGVFVGLSAFGGGEEHGHDGHHGDGHDGHIDPHGGVGHALVEGAHAGGGKRPWLPFTSFRFWTFGSFFFGLGGVALTELAQLGEPGAALVSLGIGLAGGTASALLVHQLGKPVGAPPEASHWVGRTAELLFPLASGAHSKVRLLGQQSERDLVVTLAERGPSLPKGTRVVILRIDAEGRGLVAPEAIIFRDLPPGSPRAAAGGAPKARGHNSERQPSLAVEEQRTSNQEEES